jgi:ATP-dependent Clp protease ATP-binding subunit ClpA
LEPKKVTLEVDQGGREWLARRGYDPKMGARPMARIIQENIKRLLAEELLFGRLLNGGQVVVSTRDGDLQVEIAEEEAVP